MEVIIEKNKNDKFDYKGYKLNNNIRLWIVSDSKSSVSACSFSMEVGSFDSPKDYYGLPHFLEHMIFLGSKKFPDPNYFNNFISNNGGSKNAFTGDTNTNFYYSIKNEKLLESLNIFMNLLKKPLFNKDMVEKELNAIESEFNLNYNDDGRRKNHILKMISENKSKFNNFNCGNKNTLNKEDIYEKLIEFYNNYYNTDKLSISILTNKNINDIENDVLNILNELVYKEKIIYLNLKNEIKPFNKNNLKKIIKIKNIKDQNILELIFYLEDVAKYKYIKPLEYYINLFGHESKGSILYELKNKKLANSLISFKKEIDDYFSFVNIKIKLTEKGFKNYEDVIQIVFNYIKLIKTKGIQKYIWDEISQLKFIEYNNKTKSDEINEVVYLSEAIKLFGLKEVNSLYYNMNKYDENVINNINFKLENCLIFLSSKTFENLDLIEKYYNINYSIKNIDFKINDIENNLSLPLKNDFIPKNFDKINNNFEEPKLIIENDFIKIFLKENNKYNNSKLALNMLIKTSNIFYNINYKKLLLNLWIKLLLEYCNDFIYQANLALINFNIFSNEENIELHFYGFSDSFELFFGKIFENFIKFSEDIQNNELDEIFNILHENYKLNSYNFIDNDIHDVTTNQLMRILTNYNLNFDELYNLIKTIDYNSIKEFDKSIFKEIKFELIINGNFIEDKVKNIHEILDKFISNKKSNSLYNNSIIRTCNIKKEYNFLKYLPEKEKNNSYLLCFLLGNKKIHRYFCISLISWINANYFNQLRTNQQLGYFIYVNYYNLRGNWYFYFYIQSDTKNSLILNNKTFEFINDFKETISNLPNDQFKNIIENSIIKLKKEYLNYKEENNDYFIEIKNNQYLWNKNKIYYNEIINTDVTEFKNILINKFTKESSLNLHIISKKFKEEFLKNLEEFKENDFITNNDKIFLENKWLVDKFFS